MSIGFQGSGPEILRPDVEHPFSPEEFFGELVMQAELRLGEAIGKDDKSPDVLWVARSRDIVTRVPLAWFRIGKVQQIGDRQQDLVEIGFPINDDHNDVEDSPITEESLERMLVGNSPNFILVHDPRDERDATIRLTSENAISLAAPRLIKRLPTLDILNKLGSYHIHPIRIIQKSIQ